MVLHSPFGLLSLSRAVNLYSDIGFDCIKEVKVPLKLIDYEKEGEEGGGN